MSSCLGVSTFIFALVSYEITTNFFPSPSVSASVTYSSTYVDYDHEIDPVLSGLISPYSYTHAITLDNKRIREM